MHTRLHFAINTDTSSFGVPRPPTDHCSQREPPKSSLDSQNIFVSSVFVMCGILSIFASTLSDHELRQKLIECSLRLRHRGPDWSGYHVSGGHAIAHERLAIINPESGEQPLFSTDGSIVVAANGEIYNYKELYAELKESYEPKTESDCEVAIPLYLQVS